jgi:hypothetical protein
MSQCGFAPSDACVWGRAYFPLARWLEPLIITPIVFAILRLIDRSREDLGEINPDGDGAHQVRVAGQRERVR